MINKEKIKQNIKDRFAEHGYCVYFPSEQDILYALDKESLTEDELEDAEQIWLDEYDKYEEEYNDKL